MLNGELGGLDLVIADNVRKLKLIPLFPPTFPAENPVRGLFPPLLPVSP